MFARGMYDSVFTLSATSEKNIVIFIRRNKFSGCFRNSIQIVRINISIHIVIHLIIGFSFILKTKYFTESC